MSDEILGWLFWLGVVAALFYAFWSVVSTILVVVLCLAVVIPTGIWGIKKYIYLVNEPEARLLIEKGRYGSALEELTRLPKARMPVTEQMIGLHLDEAHAIAMVEMQALSARVAALKAEASRDIRMHGNLNDLISVVQESEYETKFAKALLSELSRAYEERT